MGLGMQIPRRLTDGQAISYYIRIVRINPSKSSGAYIERNSSSPLCEEASRTDKTDRIYEAFQSALAMQKNNKRNAHVRSLNSTMFDTDLN